MNDQQNQPGVITRELLAAILQQYTLPVFGTHGIGHWARVYENGLRIAAASTGVKTEVVELFAVFHDACRANEQRDRGHGLRGGELAKRLNREYFHLAAGDLSLLFEACKDHTRGLTEADITIQCCWDADRLDLSRVGITPDPKYLCTRAARDPDRIAWASDRASARVVPEFVHAEWLAD